jgi:poly-beta-hydroxyalkanoate depolymerase
MNSDQLSEVPFPKKRARRVTMLVSAVLAIVMIGGLTVFSRRTPAIRALMRSHDGAPQLVVDKHVVDFGAVPYRKLIEATFELSNGGKEVLEFIEAPYIEVVKGCCPPSPVLGKKSLRPGEKTTLSISFMMYQGMGGPHDFRVHLPTNDPDMPDRTVQVLSDWK